MVTDGSQLAFVAMRDHSFIGIYDPAQYSFLITQRRSRLTPAGPLMDGASLSFAFHYS
jgi:hypothetical protein